MAITAAGAGAGAGAVVVLPYYSTHRYSYVPGIGYDHHGFLVLPTVPLLSPFNIYNPPPFSLHLIRAIL